MKKFKVTICTTYNHYQNIIVEAEDKQDAYEKAGCECRELGTSVINPDKLNYSDQEVHDVEEV